MKTIKKWKKIVTLAGIAYFSLAALFSPATTLIAEASEETTVSPCADIIEWRFKYEDGKLYRRLFNYSTNSWIGEWEYVTDVE